jgi:hypothetical protein
VDPLADLQIIASNGGITDDLLNNCDRFLFMAIMWSTIVTIMSVFRMALMALMGKLRDSGL